MPRTDMLSIKEGDNLVNVEEDDLPYVYKRVLGHGHTSWVEEVEDESTNKVFARKRIPIIRYRKEERAKVFRNEIAIIRGLDKHHHMIRVFATYVTSKNFGLILQPVASDGDLHAYLATFKELSDRESVTQRPDARLEPMTTVLKRAFGCLTAGLAFMHDKKVRHKDIKPHNILVHDGRVIYTDFGYAFDFSGFTRSTTEGAPNALTKRYSSPELLMHEPRNSKSDVFSLGCVLIEILATLIRDDVLEDALNLGFASAVLDKIHHHLSRMQHVICPAILIEITKQMTERNASKRIGSSQAAAALVQLPTFCCQQCAAYI
ncbi:kinase-like domain-containing protein [Phaeosphaeria sp. MPI-PUGE-AT-0046c]|nr:kinase-like domain-containing protein [Phaeosphaeria sp. MPI-PUGE-AT-0046c]